MPKIITSLSLLVCLLVISGFTVLNADAAPRRINGVAAKANGRVVTTNEVAFMLAPRRAELAARFPRRGNAYNKELATSKRKIIDELINQQLIIHEFKAMGADIPQHAVNQKINEHIMNNYQGNEKAFRKQLKTDGLSYDKFAKLTKDRLIGQAMRAQHFNDAAPATPAEIKAEYGKHKEKLRDKGKDKIDFEKIYVAKEDKNDLLATPESQLQLAEEIIKKIKKGEDFAALAKKHSTDGFENVGGKQANIARTDLSPAISNILFAEAKGSVLGPLEDSGGYHIIRVTKKVPGPPVPLSKVKEYMEREVQNRKSSARFNRYMERLRKKAIIKIN